MTNIKFCGLMQPEDIAAANRLTPQFVGLVFAPKSRRRVTAQVAAALKKQLDPKIKAVGVFVNEEIDTVTKIAAEVGLDLIQLHGAEDEDYIAALKKRAALPIIKAFVIRTAADLLNAPRRCPADHILLDAGAGTGTRFDWSLLADFPRPYFLAGGLTPQNVGEAVARLKPWAVDVSSGIETDGRKDFAKMQLFADKVKLW